MPFGSFWKFEMSLPHEGRLSFIPGTGSMGERKKRRKEKDVNERKRARVLPWGISSPGGLSWRTSRKVGIFTNVKERYGRKTYKKEQG